jgi:HEAT repeat protein
VPSTAFGPNSSLEDLASGLESKSLSRRVDAIRAVWSSTWPFEKSLVPLLIKSLGTNSDAAVFTRTQRSRLSAEAAVALGMLGAQAISALPPLAGVLGDPDEIARVNAVEAIKRIDPGNPKVVPGLLKAMKDPSVRVQYAANEALVEAGPVNTNVVRAFIAAVRANATRFRADGSFRGVPGDIVPTSQEFFHLLGPEQHYALPELAALAKDSNAGVRRMGFIGLTGIGDIPEEFVPALLQMLASADEVAIEALKTMGPKAKAIVPQLTGVLPDPRGRPIAASILAAIGAPGAADAIPAFEKCIKEEQNPPLYLCEDLLKIAPSSKVALDGFEKFAAHPEPSVGPNSEMPADLAGIMVAHARLIQGNRAPQMHFLYLAAKLRSPQERVCACAAQLLLDCNAQNPIRTNAVNRMFELLETSKDDGTFAIAEQALDNLGANDKDYVPRLIAGITNAPNLAAIAALGRIGPDAQAALPRLRALLRYRSEDADIFQEARGSLDPWSAAVRKAADEAIQKIAPGTRRRGRARA